MPKKIRKKKNKSINITNDNTGFSKSEWYGVGKRQRSKRKTNKNKVNNNKTSRLNDATTMPSLTDKVLDGAKLLDYGPIVVKLPDTK